MPVTQTAMRARSTVHVGAGGADEGGAGSSGRSRPGSLEKGGELDEQPTLQCSLGLREYPPGPEGQAPREDGDDERDNGRNRVTGDQQRPSADGANEMA